MKERLLRLAARIRSELPELSRVVARAEQGWVRARHSDDDLYLDGVALNLHGFYSSLERLFELVASGLDGFVPQGPDWHRSLLEQMAAERPGIRPAVISSATHARLEAYRGFRHVVRNLYGFQLADRFEEAMGIQKLKTDSGKAETWDLRPEKRKTENRNSEAGDQRAEARGRRGHLPCPEINLLR